MDVRDTRRENLLKLIGNNSQRAWAASVGMQPAHVNQILKQKRNIGYKLARKIEAKLGLDDCWLDRRVSIRSAVVDPIALATIISSVQNAVDRVGLAWSVDQVSRLSANLYALYEQTGEMPNVEQAAQLEALREG